jgi:hypothetical protein
MPQTAQEDFITDFTCLLVALGGLVVIVLTIGHKVRWFKPGQ